MPVRLRRSHDGAEELPDVIRRECEPIALERDGVVVLDRVRKPSRGSHYGDRPVAEGDELRQAAGLVARGHPQHVRPGVDPLREWSIETDGRGDLRRAL